jgi:UPF0271 protein
MRSRPAAIDLNADLGEGFPNDEALMGIVTSASVSCGAHAGDRETILRTLHAARTRGVVVGAHPGYPDRVGFGRRAQALPADEVESLILTQFSDLAALASEAGVALRFLKPHGALYNQAQREEEVAQGVIAAVDRLRLPLLGQPGSRLEGRAAVQGVRFVTEGFPDRGYRPDGRLVGRGEPGAVLTDLAEIEAQAVRLADQGMATLCIHGDDPRALANAERVTEALLREQITVRSFI